MAKIYHSSNQWALAGLFKRMCSGDNLNQLLCEVRHMAAKVDSSDIAAAQQILIDEGHAPRVLDKIAAAFMQIGLRKKNVGPTEPKLPDDHILKRMFAEHALTRCYVADLIHITGEIGLADNLTDVSSEFRYLTKIAVYFAQVKKQVEREDDLIFPYLKKYGWDGLYRTAQEEHKRIKNEIDNLTVLVTGFNTIGFKDFKTWLPLVVKRFCPLILNHISYEQETLWPIALIIIDDPAAWKTIGFLTNQFEY